MLFSRHPSSASVRDLCLSLGRLIKAGIGLDEAIGSISDSCDRKTRALLEGLVQRVRRGATLADAMAAFPRVFNSAEVARVRAGEAIGHVHAALEEVANTKDRKLQARSRLIRRCIYPGMLIVAWIFLSPIALLVTGPASAYFLAVLKSLSILGAILAAVFLGIPAIGRRPGVQERVSRVAWLSPWPGTVYRDNIRGVLCRLLSAHIAAGLPLPQSIRAAADATGDDILRERATHALREIDRGEAMADAFVSAELLPSKDGMLLHSGERAGTIPEALAALAGNYEDRAQRGLMSLVAIGGAFLGLLGFAYIALSIVEAFQTIMGGTYEIMNTIQRDSGIRHR